MFTSLQPQPARGKAGPGSTEQAALGGQAAEADIAEWSPAWPEESPVEREW